MGNLGLNTGFIISNMDQKKLKKVPILITDKPGINKKVYPKDVVENAIQQYLDYCKKDPTRKYIFAKHPKDEDEEWIGLIAGVCDNLYLENKVLYADITLLPTIWGYTIYWLLKNNYTIGTSIRGYIKSIEDYYDLEDRKILVKKATKLRFDGFDFVVFPSYMVTQAKYENIKEQILPSSINESFDSLCSLTGICNCSIEKVLEQTKVDNVITLEEIKEQIKEELKINNISNKNNDRFRRYGMDKETLKTEIERLKLEKARHEYELEKVKEQLLRKKAELDDVEQKLQSELEKVQEQREKSKAEELYLEKLAMKKAELEKVQEQVNEFEEKIESLRKELAELEAKKVEFEKTQEARKAELVVDCCGKTFNKENKPKIRVVPVVEAISKKDWGSIDHDVTKKLVYLTGNEELAKEVFGLVDMKQGWNGLKYPVYEHRKSSESEYDVDLVLNLNGLKTALVFIQGKPGMVLSKNEKRQIVKFLSEKYNELLENEIIDNIPESLERLEKALKILEKVNIETENEIVKALVETAFVQGLIDVESDEAISESLTVEVDSDLVLRNYAIALSKALEGETLSFEKSVEQSGNAVQVLSYNDGLEKLWNLLTDTDFSANFNLSTQDDFDAFLKSIISAFVNGDIVTGLKQISVLQDALRGTGAVHVVIPTLIFALDESSKNNQQNNEEQNKQNNEENNQQNNENTTNEQIQYDFPDNEEKTTENIKEEEMKDETFGALKTILEGELDVQIPDEESLIPVMEKLVNDYSSMFEEFEQLKLELAKRDAVLKAISLETDLEAIKEQLESAESVEDVEEIIAQLEQNDEKMEKTEEKATGKGITIVDVDDKNTKEDKFTRILDEI